MPYKNPIIRAVKGLERSKKYRLLRPEKVKENARKNYIKRREYMIAKTKKYQKENRETYLVSKKNTSLKKLYGITIIEYKEMFEKQKGVCAICFKHNKSSKKLGVDHNHTTGKVRSLLCDKCNRGIGFFNEDIELLKKVIKYLKKHA